MTHSMKYFEDFVIGDVLSLGEKTVVQEEVLAYARELDPAPMHLDDTAARDALRLRHEVADPDEATAEVLVPLEGLAASDWHVGAMFMRTFFEGLLVSSSSRGSPGIEMLGWPNPVYPGDIIRFSLEVMDVKPSRSRPDLGLVLFDMTGINQRGEPILVARSWTMMGRREAGSPEPSARSEGLPRVTAAQLASHSPAPGSATRHGQVFFDDMDIGAVTELGEYLFSAGDIIRFARAFDPQPFHISEEAGKASIFGGLAASGWQSAAVWQKLTVAHETTGRAVPAVGSETAPPDVLMPGVTDVRWLKPVLAGDTVSYRTTITEKTRSETVPGWGVVLSRAEGFNQRGDLVFHMIARRFAKLRV